MKHVIIGSGATGLMLSIMLKQKYHDDVIVIEKNSKIAKKLYATGNGKCNIGNSFLNEYSYNDKIAYELINDFDLNKQREFIHNLGIMTKMHNNLCYPYSESAKNYIDYLIKVAHHLGVSFELESQALDYGNNEVRIANRPSIHYDKLYICVGGSSSPIFGTDGNYNDILIHHGYSLTNTYPGLAPLKTLEKTSSVKGERIKAKVKLLNDKKVIYEDQGEVLFKPDGLSGIVIMNISSMIARNYKENSHYQIVLDVIGDNDIEVIKKVLVKNTKSPNKLDALFSNDLSNYLMNLLHISNVTTVDEIINKLQHVVFNFKGFYDFKESQVTVGGVSLNDINLKTFESNIEKNVYFGGEILNLDGLCGGYNLMLCTAIAYKIVSALSK